MPVEFAFPFPLPNGLHTRPASLLREAALPWRSAVWFVNDRRGTKADARSTLALLATDTAAGDPCRLVVDGPDEHDATAALREFVSKTIPRADDDLAPPPERSSLQIPFPLRQEAGIYLAGIPAAAGLAQAPVFVAGNLAWPDEIPLTEAWDEARERERFRQAAAGLGATLAARKTASASAIELAILQAHQAILADPDFSDRVEATIRAGSCSAGEAVRRAAAFYTQALGRSASAYLRERVADIRDVAGRLLASLGWTPPPSSPEPPRNPYIHAAENLTPSQFLALDRNLLKGLILEQGGTNSHVAILARAFGVPAVVGLEGLSQRLTTGEEVLLDGARGLLFPSPSSAVQRYYAQEASKLAEFSRRRAAAGKLTGQTRDGKRLEIAANVGSPEEVGPAVANGAEGVGLFRTEFLFMDRDAPPTEAEQFEAYRRCAEASGGRPVIVRTADIGGDKPLAYLNLPQEDNPFLGCRAVRLLPRHEALLADQLRAVLRAAVYGPLKIMVPMVSAVEEVRSVRQVLDRVRNELSEKGIPHNAATPLGIMVEVPAAALHTAALAREVDFFSLGSNDLLQYTVAADRGNAALAGLYTPLQPAFLRLLRTVADEGRRAGRWVGICGEMAGRVDLLPLLVGLGLDELSLSPAGIPAVKEAVRRLDSTTCRRLLDTTVDCATAAQVAELLRAFHTKGAAEPLVEPGLIRLDAEIETRAEAVKGLVDALDLAGRLADADPVEEAVWQREAVYSTGIGFGVAIPHCKHPAVRATSAALLRLTHPIAWQPGDEDLVDLVILLAVKPGGAENEHLRLIAKLSRRLMSEEYRAGLRSAASPEEVARNLSEGVVGG